MIGIDTPMPQNCTTCKFLRFNREDFVKMYRCTLNDEIDMSAQVRPQKCPLIDLRRYDDDGK